MGELSSRLSWNNVTRKRLDPVAYSASRLMSVAYGSRRNPFRTHCALTRGTSPSPPAPNPTLGVNLVPTFGLGGASVPVSFFTHGRRLNSVSRLESGP